jgi:RNA recognition motif-containing protein
MNIYAGNLAYGMTEEDLQQVFSEYGVVVKANIIFDRETGRSKGFGFVEMENEEEGEKAIEALDGFLVKGRNLKVNQARPREERPRRNSW